MILEEERLLVERFANAVGAQEAGGRLYTDGFELIDLKRVIGVATWDIEWGVCYVWIPWHPVGELLIEELGRYGRTWCYGPTGEVFP